MEIGRHFEHQSLWPATSPEILNEDSHAAHKRPALIPPSPDPHNWSQLMRRVFSLNLLLWARCGGRRELISLITNPPIIRRIL
jgi:hypothetical protein